MAYAVDFKNVSTTGFDTSLYKESLAGLRANESRYFKTKYDTDFITYPAFEKQETLDYVNELLRTERDIVIQSKPLEVAILHVPDIQWTYVFYESGLSINILYHLTDPKKRAVGFKLSYGMPIPDELNRFNFAKMKSKLATEIRGSFFIIKKH
jgi:hypothetical protein